jgi:HlyD family secretion protein
LLILVAVAAGALSWMRRSAAQKSIQAVNAVAEPVTRELSLAGRVQALHVVPVGAAVNGTIDAILVEVGQEVFEGQLLARISNQGLEALREEAVRTVQNAQERVNSIGSRIIATRLEASRARADASRSRDQFERAEKTYLRQQMLNREGATPRLVYEKSEREFENARSEFNSLDQLARQAEDRVSEAIRDLETAKRALDERNAELETATAQSAAAEIRSPVSGILVARKADPGKIVGPEEARDLLEIAVDLTQLAVAVQPDPKALQHVRPGQDALIFIADLPGAIPGNIKEIKGSDVIVEFTSPSAVIRPGMTAQVRLKLE